ncbi:hypothetical protein [Bradyrhizobium iriomotense]|uniref:Uncharacterized protein n=1 Tax=Bradyrhizobium iriomotense TaxID=441950 RepID=A0ABQ6AYV4_9BRAD|nr:hypothetical protein [Bradyrhizobium iriomotense]GLR86416.1 hypothetical protein GCM10007857_31270 [Bradyrhizobium iriomotense]
MIDLEASVRDLINRDRDCSESALRLLGLRQDMKQLIADWKAAGGGDLLPNIGERVSLRANVKNDPKPNKQNDPEQNGYKAARMAVRR